MKQLKLIGFFLCLFIMGLVIGANAQKRTLLEVHLHEDTTGVSVAYKEAGEEWGFDYLTKEEFNSKFTDQYTGEVWKGKYPILLSVNNKRFVMRESKSGKRYRYYLKQ
jgi:hypothetical protein